MLGEFLISYSYNQQHVRLCIMSRSEKFLDEEALI